MPKKPLTKKEKQMRTGAVARQNMFLGGMTQSQIGDMVKQYQASNPSTPPTKVAPATTLTAGNTAGNTAANTNLGNINLSALGGSGLGVPDLSFLNTGATSGTATADAAAKATADAADKAVADKAAADKAAADKAVADKVGVTPVDGSAVTPVDGSAILNTLGAGSSGTDILGKFANSGLNDEQIYDLLYTSVQNNPNSPFAAGAQSLLSTMKFNSETGKNEFFQTTDNNNQKTGSADKPNTSPQWVEINRVDNGDGTDTVSFQDQNANSPSYNKIITQIRKRGDGGDSDGSSNGGTGTGTGTGTGGVLEQRYGDVINQMDKLAGLTPGGTELPTGGKYDPVTGKILEGELLPSEGTQLKGSPTAATTTAASTDLQAQVPTEATTSTVDSLVASEQKVNALALTAQATNALSQEAVGEEDTVSANATITDEKLKAIKPDPESIEVIKSEGALAKEVAKVDRRDTPTVGLDTAEFNESIEAAKRSMEVGDTIPVIDPRIAQQAEKEVQYEKTQEATMQLAQFSDDPETSAFATAQQQAISEVPVEATVQGQLTNLMAQFADGKTPPYAAGAIRNAEAQMAARGLSASSMAGAAIMQAAMESSIPIAAQDAQVFKEINLTNLNNKQQVALANAANSMNIGLANLSASQQTNLQNSTNGFKLQSQSLSNLQQVAVANAQLRSSLKERELSFDQQKAVANAARYSEIQNVNLSNEQQGIMQDSINNMQVTMGNLSNKQQRNLAQAQIDSALVGQELTGDQQRSVLNAARVAEVNNIEFTEQQQRNLNNAKIMENMTLTNLDADMKAALTNAATYANMDITNLNNRQQAEVLNAQSFLQLDMANLTNKQQGEVLQYQAKTQALFSDAASDNARKQFNAQSENQMEQFFSQLGATVRNQNVNRIAAMRQFNTNETNAQARFNTSLTDTREKFNSTMTSQINQSNAKWRRDLNTMNTASANEANRINALNTLSVNQNSLNKIWQGYRDEANWLNSKSMSRDQYMHEIAKIGLAGDVDERLFNHQNKTEIKNKFGSTIWNWLKGL